MGWVVLREVGHAGALAEGRLRYSHPEEHESAALALPARVTLVVAAAAVLCHSYLYSLSLGFSNSKTFAENNPISDSLYDEEEEESQLFISLKKKD